MGYQTEDADPPARRRGGCLLGLIVLVLGVCIVAVIAVLVYASGEPNTIQVNAVVPASVTLGQTASVEVTVLNVSVDPVTIRGVGLSSDFLEGLGVVSSDPPYRSVADQNYPFYGQWTEYRFDARLAPGGSLTVNLVMLANQPGLFSGELSVWTETRLLGMSLARAQRIPVELRVQR